MKRLLTAALAAVAVCVVAGSALAATGIKSSVIFDSTNPNGPKTNIDSYGPAAYSFTSIGDKVTFDGTARSLSNVTVTLSSWACQQGSWNGKDCLTQPGATFSQPITLKITNPENGETMISTKTFDIPYRPSASAKCTDANAGKWMTPSKVCKNGLANDVTFNLSGAKLPDTVVYEISFLTGGPADSLNVAVTDAPSVGTSTDTSLWINGAPNTDFGAYTPVVQFKAGNAS